MNALELGAVPTSEDDNMDQKDIESCSLAAANEKDAAEFSKSFISSSEILKDDSVNIIAATTSVDAVGIKMAKEVVDPSMLKTVFSQLETMEKDMDSKFLPVLTRVYNERNDKRVENKQLLDQLEHLRMQAVESAHEDLSSKDDSNDTLRSSVDKLQQELLELEQQKAALQEDNESLVEAKAQAKMQLRQLTEHFDVERSSLIERALQAEERLVLLTQNQESRSVELEKVSQLEAEVERLQEKMAVNEELDRTTCFAKQLEEKEALQNQLSESLEENQRLGSQHQQEVNELCSQISTLQNARDEEQMTYAKEKESLNKIISAVTDENRELKQLQAQLEVEVHRLQLQAQDLHVARAAENIEKDEIINKLKEEIIELTEKVRDFEARGSENNALNLS
ncbi:hypothetical protein BC829DRAFT_198620 [Chytridium lagenaria]|nr:hypothetical protein BC829DRAFT_198620 [Chytridium lagenaria]